MVFSPLLPSVVLCLVSCDDNSVSPIAFYPFSGFKSPVQASFKCQISISKPGGLSPPITEQPGFDPRGPGKKGGAVFPLAPPLHLSALLRVLVVESQVGKEGTNVSKLLLFFHFEAPLPSLAMPSAGLAANTSFLLGQITKLHRVGEQSPHAFP